MTRDLLDNTTIKGLIPAQRSTAATIAGSAVDLKGMGRKVLVTLDVGGVEGTTPTVDVVVEESDGGTTWTTLHTFVQQTTAALLEADLTPTKARIRAVATIAGGTGAGATIAVLGIIYLERQIPSGI